MSPKTLQKLVVIYIKDHLISEESLNMNDDLNHLESSLNREDDTILFPYELQYEVSKEEIGKWMDQLIELPEPENSHTCLAEEFADNIEDPFTHVAEQILSDEIF
jgi:hypothetical protein